MYDLGRALQHTRVPCAQCRRLQTHNLAHSRVHSQHTAHQRHATYLSASTQANATASTSPASSQQEEESRPRPSIPRMSIPAEILQELEEDEQQQKEEAEARRRMEGTLAQQEELKSSGQTSQQMVSEGYHAIKMDGCEFLIASDNDGRLDLTDIYVQDEDSGIFARPSFTGNTPAAANFYSEIEWREEFLGDVVFNKPPQIMTKKVYLIHITELLPRRLDLEKVWMLDADTRSVQQAPVQRMTQSQDPAELTLRIRQDGSLLVQRAETMPSADELIWASQSGYEAASRPEIEDPDETLSDPIDAIQDDFDEPDVPAVDLA